MKGHRYLRVHIWTPNAYIPLTSCTLIFADKANYQKHSNLQARPAGQFLRIQPLLQAKQTYECIYDNRSESLGSYIMITNTCNGVGVWFPLDPCVMVMLSMAITSGSKVSAQASSLDYASGKVWYSISAALEDWGREYQNDIKGMALIWTTHE